MTTIIGFVSQKGGVGKSTLARLIGREAAGGGLSVKIGDLDTQQTTSTLWAARRSQNEVEPAVRVEAYADLRIALNDASAFDVFLIDGAPHSSKETLEIARAADFVVIPTSQSLDDLHPSVLLAHELVKKGISRDTIAFALCKVTDSIAEVREARSYLEQAGYQVLEGEVPYRTGFSKALDQGKAITETPFKTLTQRAETLAQSIIDAAVSAMERRAA
jgi:chromosome partitioning protein|tara:strand:+ start:4906 stop:5559 length:654 start_codon:yes stop_codon:yes gene_type:complete